VKEANRKKKERERKKVCAAEGSVDVGCCTLDETAFAENDLPQSHVWIWDVVGMLMFCGWMAVFQYLQYSLAEAVNLRNINVAQYAVLVSNVGNVRCEEASLEEYGRVYGDVVSTFFVRDFGRFLAKDAEVLSLMHHHTLRSLNALNACMPCIRKLARNDNISEFC
jgi:hypothetical protein